MPEQQNIEYKQNWHDDYLKWVCGFANAQGGVIYIGKDDNGKVVGITDYKKLLEDLPNKIRDVLGIMVDVNLLNTSGLFYLEIIIHPYIVPISLRGRYYYRSGSTKQELIGTALTDFLLRKTGKSWDEVIEPTASLLDIDEVSLAIFISASLKAGRISDVDGLSTGALLSKLRLIDDKGNIKRAAIVLFGKSVSKFYNNCIVKIGRFKSNEEELIFQELEEGNIIQLLKDIPSQLNRKFLIKPISFEGLQRIEKGEYPVAAIREMLLNALVHRSYLGTVVQIRVYDNSINIWNEGLLPEGLSLGSLKRQHPSRPRNQLIADVCFKGGYIDTWGRGTLKIINACLEAELPEPEILEQDGGILVTLYKNKYSAEQLKKMKLNGRQLEAVFYLIEKGSITNTEYQKINDISRQTATRDLKELVEKFKILRRDGITGAGTSYALIDS
jgi:ATP-dependent DNA helicase RecG